MANNANKNAASLELREPLRFITDYNSEGKSVFSAVLDSEMTPMDVFNVTLHDAFVSTTSPAQMNGGTDLEAMQSLPPATGIGRDDATVVRLVDFPPGQTTFLHRTVTIDYGVHIAGDLELVLDSGETRRLMPGDVVVQRGTNHAWRNPHPTEPARAFFVMAPIVPLIINREQLGEHIEVPKEASL
ncbi:hypothetical protein KJ359_008374 [Pestalotiopsis sp. 9143b]|nr:hypothetical protein KJ359_008374 [Pestalotiopsis sp. 9143b]